MRNFSVVMLALLLAACAVPPAATATGLITRQQAVAAAVERASMSAPEVSGALIAPTNVQASQITLGEALLRMGENANPPGGYSRELPVWYVTMDGLWEGEMTAPGVTVTPARYRHCIVVLDAVTGMEIQGALRP
ncbi:MAG TPA: hypothetical protein VF784_14465 [Anaerolineales bacterium]